VYEQEPEWLVVAHIAKTVHEPKLMEPHKHHEVRWCSLEDLPGEPRKNTAQIIKDLLSPWGRDTLKRLDPQWH
jgi:hypothetical protein